MVLSSGIDNLTPDVDLNEIYAANINVAYKVMGNSAKNYPTTDKGLLIVTEIDNVILQTYITKKRVYRRYGEIKSYTVYDDSQMQQEIPPKEGEVGADSPVPPVGTIVTSATFTDWLYEIYGYDKDIATETDYGLISETRLKYLINTYAPAYDPFVTAQAISEYVEKQNKRAPITNIYLSPLSTKPHALGMALYFLWEHGFNKNISLIYPYCQQYITDNSDGIARIWRYEIQLP